MKNRRIWIVGITTLSSLTVASALYKVTVPEIESQQRLLFQQFDELERMNAYVVGEDGKSIGKIKSGFEQDALGNENGAGATYKTDGLFCTYGKYGSTYNTTSAFCKYATDPPRIAVKEGNKVRYIGVLTMNPSSTAKGQKINPYLLKAWFMSK